MKVMGISTETALRNRIATRIQQEKYVAMRVDPLVKVSEDEISAYYEANRESLQLPERIRAKHIFLATLNKLSEEAQQTLVQALAAVKRHQAVNDFRSTLRRFEAEKIDIFQDKLTL